MCNNGKIYGNLCAVVGDRQPNMENNVGKYGEFRQQSEKQFLFSIHELTILKGFLVFLSTVVSFN